MNRWACQKNSTKMNNNDSRKEEHSIWYKSKDDGSVMVMVWHGNEIEPTNTIYVAMLSFFTCLAKINPLVYKK